MNIATNIQPILSVEGVEKSYGKVKALGGVDLVIRPGEFVVLLGPNGAGKSTLLQILTGLFSADAGRVRIFGAEFRSNPTAALARIGVIFQQPTLDLELTVLANLRYHADLHGLPRRLARQRIEEALQRVGLQSSMQAPSRTLSGGNRRRVELARAMVHNPALLLMDEATAGLDPASRRSILEHIMHLTRDRQLGVLWTTHLIDEAEHADRLVVLHKGRVLFDGHANQLIQQQGSETLADAFLMLTGAPSADASPEL